MSKKLIIFRPIYIFYFYDELEIISLSEKYKKRTASVSWSVLCVHVLVGLPSVCMCVSVSLRCVCALCALGRSALCALGRSALCGSVCLVCGSVCLVCGSVCLVCGSVCLVCGSVCLVCGCSSSFAWGGRECHFLFSSAPLKYWKASCSKLASPPPPPPPHTHTIQYSTSQHKINHHCNQCFKDNVCKQRNLLVLGGWLSWVLYFILSKLKIYMGVMCICQWFNLYWNIHPHFALPIWM